MKQEILEDIMYQLTEYCIVIGRGYILFSFITPPPNNNKKKTQPKNNTKRSNLCRPMNGFILPKCFEYLTS